MNDAKKEKLKKTLVELKLMEPEDVIVECLQANYRKKLLGNLGEWKQGWVYFTEKRLLYPTGILDENIVIPYERISRIEKCSQGLLPMGIAITYANLATDESVTDRISLMKRDKWISFLQEKSGLSVAP